MQEDQRQGLWNRGPKRESAEGNQSNRELTG